MFFLLFGMALRLRMGGLSLHNKNTGLLDYEDHMHNSTARWILRAWKHEGGDFNDYHPLGSKLLLYYPFNRQVT